MKAVSTNTLGISVDEFNVKLKLPTLPNGLRKIARKSFQPILKVWELFDGVFYKNRNRCLYLQLDDPYKVKKTIFHIHL